MKSLVRERQAYMEKILNQKRIKIIAKPNSPKTEITKIEKDFLRVNVKAKPEKGKANKEIIKFFTKLLKKKVSITKGLKTKEKTLIIE